MGKRELVALLNLSSWCLVTVERLYIAVPRVCLRFVIVVFPDHIHLLFLGPLLGCFTDRSKAVLLLWIFYIFFLSCVCYAFVCVCLCALRSPDGKGLTSGLSFVVSNMFV